MLDKVKDIAGPAVVAGATGAAPWWVGMVERANLLLATASLVVGITAGLLTIRAQLHKGGGK